MGLRSNGPVEGDASTVLASLKSKQQGNAKHQGLGWNILNKVDSAVSAGIFSFQYTLFHLLCSDEAEALQVLDKVDSKLNVNALNKADHQQALKELDSIDEIVIPSVLSLSTPRAEGETEGVPFA
jgi:hypothetical protein